ncbi:hypothetical protein D3C73_1000270 [compost metagenome]
MRAAIVLADYAILFGFFQAFHAIATNMSGSDLGFLRIIMRNLDQRLAALFIEFRQRDAKVLPIDDRVEAKVRFANGTFYSPNHGLVPDRDTQHAGLRHGDVRHLIQRHARAVGLNGNRIQNVGRRATGSQRRDIALEGIDCAFHAALDVVEID